jgi:hypothetical protein
MYDTHPPTRNQCALFAAVLLTSSMIVLTHENDIASLAGTRPALLQVDRKVIRTSCLGWVVATMQWSHFHFFPSHSLVHFPCVICTAVVNPKRPTTANTPPF